MTHTPGPWYKSPEDGDKIRDAYGNAIASIELTDSESTCNANARLIAAAPELLEALKEVSDWDADSLIEDEWPYLIGKVRAAIAKAEEK